MACFVILRLICFGKMYSWVAYGKNEQATDWQIRRVRGQNIPVFKRVLAIGVDKQLLRVRDIQKFSSQLWVLR